eukprot:jgi/Bigna1/80544/fgenesh1_pg.72_\
MAYGGDFSVVQRCINDELREKNLWIMKKSAILIAYQSSNFCVGNQNVPVNDQAEGCGSWSSYTFAELATQHACHQCAAAEDHGPPSAKPPNRFLEQGSSPPVGSKKREFNRQFDTTEEDGDGDESLPPLPPRTMQPPPRPDSLNFDWENMRRVSAGGQRNLSASMPSALTGRGELKSLEKQLRREDRMERTKDFSFNVEEEIDGIAELKKWRTITIPEDLTAGRHTTEEQKKLANLYKSRMREKWVVRRIGDVLRQAVEECQILDEQKGLNENAIVEGLLDQLSQLVVSEPHDSIVPSEVPPSRSGISPFAVSMVATTTQTVGQEAGGGVDGRGDAGKDDAYYNYVAATAAAEYDETNAVGEGRGTEAKRDDMSMRTGGDNGGGRGGHPTQTHQQGEDGGFREDQEHLRIVIQVEELLNTMREEYDYRGFDDEFQELDAKLWYKYKWGGRDSLCTLKGKSYCCDSVARGVRESRRRMKRLLNKAKLLDEHMHQHFFANLLYRISVPEVALRYETMAEAYAKYRNSTMFAEFGVSSANESEYLQTMGQDFLSQLSPPPQAVCPDKMTNTTPPSGRMNPPVSSAAASHPGRGERGNNSLSAAADEDLATHRSITTEMIRKLKEINEYLHKYGGGKISHLVT